MNTTIIYLDESKYSVEQIIENQKANDKVKNLLFVFHNRLISQLNSNNKYSYGRVNINGITYFCNEKKAFLFLNVRQGYLTANFFTGHKIIKGICKANWLHKNDNLGSKALRIKDETILSSVFDFAQEAYRIAEDWSN